jgi:M6 family metalloprotease-like protein
MRTLRRQTIVSCVVLGIVCSCSLWATPPEQKPNGQAGGPGEEYVPEAGYLRTLQLLQLRRAVTPQPRNLAPGLNLSLSGVRSIPVICVEFSNRPHQFQVADYQANLFDPPGAAPQPRRATLTQYYRDVSQGRFVPTGSVVGWYPLPQNDAFYEAGNNGLNERLGELLTVAFQRADADLDFGQFDNDGPDGLPNSGDDDGVVDTVFIIHSETGGECGTANVWSHSFQYSKFTSNNGRPFVTQDVRRNEFGQPVLAADGSPSRIQINDYTVQPALACPDASAAGPRIIPIGVFCHEYGHALGLPDLYDRTPGSPSGPDSEGVGNYCLMAGGSYGATGRNAATPVHMSAWCKAVLGWANIQTISANGTLPLESVQERNLIYNVEVPNTGGKEFFLIEYRDPNWTDPFNERLNWDREISPGGLAIWHVDERVGATFGTWPFTPPDEGQNDAPSLPSGTPASFHPNKHALITLIQSDGLMHLERKQNRGDPTDLFVTGGIHFQDDPNCRCGSRGFNGQPTGISLKNINLAARTAQVRLDDFPGQLPIVAAPPVPRPAPQPAAVAAAPAAPPPEVLELRSLGAKVVREGQGALEDSERAKIARAPDQQLRQGNTPQGTSALLKIATQQRTKQVDATFNAVSQPERTVKQMVETSRSETPATVCFDASNTRLERLTGLDIPTAMMSNREDAQMRVQSQLRGTFGDGVELKATDAAQATSGQVSFQQLLPVNGAKLPLYGDRVKFYYSENALKAVEANVVDPGKVRIEGTPESLPIAEAQQIVIDRLGVPRERIGDCSHVIYLPGGDPGHACVTAKVNIKSGGNRKDLEAFINCATKEIIQVR